MNPSRCSGPTDPAYINLDVSLTPAYSLDFNPVADIRLSAWWNTSATVTGATKIGDVILPTSVPGETLNLPWNPPDTPGEYYVYMKGEVKVEGGWYEFHAGWTDAGEPIYVSNAPPPFLSRIRGSSNSRPSPSR